MWCVAALGTLGTKDQVSIGCEVGGGMEMPPGDGFQQMSGLLGLRDPCSDRLRGRKTWLPGAC